MSAAPKPILVALADDHKMLRQLLRSSLDQVKGFRVVCDAANGRELLDRLEAATEQPDVCILDVSMPVMNGYDTLLALKERYPHMRVLVLTMIDHQGNFLRMLNAGADGYLIKGQQIEDLTHAVRQVAEHGFYHNPDLAALSPYIPRKRRLVVLSEVEQAFLRLCATELPYKQIADRMGVTSKVVEGHRSVLFNRFGVKSRVGLVIYAFQSGLLPLDYNDQQNNPFA